MDKQVFYARGHAKPIIILCSISLVVFLLLATITYTSYMLALPFAILLIIILLRYNVPYVVMDDSSLLIKPAPIKEKVLILIDEVSWLEKQTNQYIIHYSKGNPLVEKNLIIYLNGMNAHEKQALTLALDALIEKVNNR